MRKFLAGLILTGGFLFLGAPVQALMLFQGNLEGSQEVPSVLTPASGLVLVVLNDAEDSLTISAHFSDLLAPQTAAHIHGLAPRGENAPVRIIPPSLPLGNLFDFSIDIPEMLPGLPELSRAEFVQGLKDGLAYFNVHSEQFPAGEIRGQLEPITTSTPVPEPASLLLFGQGMAGIAVWGWRRGRRNSQTS